MFETNLCVTPRAAAVSPDGAVFDRRRFLKQFFLHTQIAWVISGS